MVWASCCAWKSDVWLCAGYVSVRRPECILHWNTSGIKRNAKHDPKHFMRLMWSYIMFLYAVITDFLYFCMSTGYAEVQVTVLWLLQRGTVETLHIPRKRKRKAVLQEVFDEHQLFRHTCIFCEKQYGWWCAGVRESWWVYGRTNNNTYTYTAPLRRYQVFCLKNWEIVHRWNTGSRLLLL